MMTLEDAGKETEVKEKQSEQANSEAEKNTEEVSSEKENMGKLGRILKRVAITMGVLLVIALVFWIAGRLSISVELIGDPECTVEFGENYVEAGATAKFGGRWIFPQEKEEKNALIRRHWEHTNSGLFLNYSTQHWA